MRCIKCSKLFSELGDDVFVIGRSGYDEDLLKILFHLLNIFLVMIHVIPSTKNKNIV